MRDRLDVTQAGVALAGDVGEQGEDLFPREVMKRGFAELPLHSGERLASALNQQTTDLEQVDDEKDHVPDRRTVKRQRLTVKEHEPEDESAAGQDPEPEHVPDEIREEVQEIREVDASLNQVATLASPWKTGMPLAITLGPRGANTESTLCIDDF